MSSKWSQEIMNDGCVYDRRIASHVIQLRFKLIESKDPLDGDFCVKHALDLTDEAKNKWKKIFEYYDPKFLKEDVLIKDISFRSLKDGYLKAKSIRLAESHKPITKNAITPTPEFCAECALELHNGRLKPHGTKTGERMV